MRPPELPLPGRAVTLAAEPSAAEGLSDQLLQFRAGVDEAELAIRAPGEDWRILPAADAASRRTFKRMFLSEGGGSAVFGWLASQQPVGDPATVALTFQLHEFAGELALVDPLELGVDDKLIEELRRSRRIGARSSTSDAMAWLEGRFLIATGTDISWGIGTFGDRATLNLHACDSTADLAREPNASMLVTRVRPLDRRVARGNRRPTLIHGPIRFVDATQAGALRLSTTAALDAVAARADSYLRLWQEYNEIERRQLIARARIAGWVHYSERRPIPGGGWRFRLTRRADAVLDAFRAAEQDVAASEEIPEELARPDARTSTDEVQREPFCGRLRTSDDGALVDLLPEDDDTETREPPAKGVLHLSLGGDRIRLQRRERARQRIVDIDAPMVQLGLLLEGQDAHVLRRKRYARVPRHILRQFGDEGPTERQHQALLVAMNTPDIAVIQGPPGTGKTKVITALQSWLADEADVHRGLGGSVLLTSFQHDAVDNAADRTSVLDLPAVRVGGRRGIDGLRASARRWGDELRVQLEADLEGQVEAAEASRANAVARLARAYALHPRAPEATAELLREVAGSYGDLITGPTRDALVVHARDLTTRGDHGDALDERSLLIAVRALRTTANSFADDGRETAPRLLFQLRRTSLLTAEVEDMLRRASTTEEPDATLLDQLEELQERLLDQLVDKSNLLSPVPVHDRDARRLLRAAAREALDATASSRSAVGGVLAGYLDSIEHDPLAVEETLRRYASVLAATCQQSASHAMAMVKTDDDFDTVIVDEAARANPLDLMIPMSRARRRIVLVGDHRQLPHVLEPDVQQELEVSVAEETRKAFTESLFERLYQSFESRLDSGHALEEPRRTITLDTQFRMHPRLGAFVSEAFYAQDAIHLAPGREASEFPHGLSRYDDAVGAWEDVPPAEGPESSGISKSRVAEARRIAELLPELMDERPDLSFGVISFYRAQVNCIHRELVTKDVVRILDDDQFEIAPRYREGRDPDGRLIDRLRIGTVDAFQGMEFDVVILSMTRSSKENADLSQRRQRARYGHLMLANRLCVAMSRQRRLLIVVGDRQMVESSAGREAIPAMTRFLDMCVDEGRVDVLA